MKKNLLIIKWGKPIRAFDYDTLKDHTRVGHSFDLQVEALTHLYSLNFDIGLGVEFKDDVNPKLPKGVTLVHKELPMFKPDVVIVLGGLDNKEFNQPWVNFLNKLEERIPIYLYANDMRFTELKGVTRKYIKMTEIVEDTDEYFSNSRVDAYVAQYIVRKYTSLNILVQANENGENSRLETILKYAHANPRVTFTLVGEYKDPKNIEKIQNQKNIVWENDLYFGRRQLTLDQLYAQMYSMYEFALIVPMRWSEVNEDVYLNTHWPLNYVPFKFYEAVLNGVLPIFDDTQALRLLHNVQDHYLYAAPRVSKYEDLTTVLENHLFTAKAEVENLKMDIKWRASNVDVELRPKIT